MFNKQFILGEIVSLAVSYLAGFGASSLIPLFFVKKNIWNLGGLFAKREAVSGETYDWLLFFASYFIGFIVMLIVNRFMKSLFASKESE